MLKYVLVFPCIFLASSLIGFFSSSLLDEQLTASKLTKNSRHETASVQANNISPTFSDSSVAKSVSSESAVLNGQVESEGRQQNVADIEKNYPELLGSLEESPDQGLETEILLAEWAEKSPQLAWEWIASNSSRVSGTRAEFKVLYHYLLKKPHDAANIIQYLPEDKSDIRSNVLEAVANVVLLSDYNQDSPVLEKLLAWPDNFSSKDLQGQFAFIATNSVLNNYGPLASVDYLQKTAHYLPQEAKSVIAERVGAKLGLRGDISQQLSLLEKYPEDIKSALKIGVFSTGAKQSLPRIKPGIDALPEGDFKDSVINKVIASTEAHFQDTAIKIELIDEISDPALKARTLVSLIGKILINQEYDTGKKSVVIEKIEALKNVSPDTKNSVVKLIEG